MGHLGKVRFCPVCGHSSDRFLPFGAVPRPDALCERCGSLERHRLLWLFLRKRTDFFDGRAKTMLHVAPEPCLQARFRKVLGSGYLTADLLDPRAMVRMDVSDIRFPDASFDVIYCSHVLEHVPDDRKAMREFLRVLKGSGWAILLVPIYKKATLEDPSIVDPKERLRVFGQEDHVRSYGPDYIDRLREAGFAVTVTTSGDLADPEQARLMGLTSATGDIFFCTRQ